VIWASPVRASKHGLNEKPVKFGSRKKNSIPDCEFLYVQTIYLVFSSFPMLVWFGIPVPNRWMAHGSANRWSWTIAHAIQFHLSAVCVFFPPFGHLSFKVSTGFFLLTSLLKDRIISPPSFLAYSYYKFLAVQFTFSSSPYKRIMIIFLSVRQALRFICEPPFADSRSLCCRICLLVWLSRSPCSFGLISRISSHPAVFSLTTNQRTVLLAQ
jgi:hypothetical protein